MRRNQAEAWALQIIDRLQTGQPVEDVRVELKERWIDPCKAARRLAGHANAARGESILWLIGVSDDTGEVVGVDQSERSKWLQAVFSACDSVAPDLTCDVSIPINGKTVVAFVFATDRAPYVVKNPVHGAPGGGPVSLEVPWREATRVRSASRSDLLRLLVPLGPVPEVEPINAECETTTSFGDDAPEGARFRWKVLIDCYLIPAPGRDVVIPFHRCTGSVNFASLDESIELSRFFVAPPKRRYVTLEGVHTKILSITAENTVNEFIATGPTRMEVTASGYASTFPDHLVDSVAVLKASVFVVASDRPIGISIELSPAELRPDVVGHWQL